MKFSSSRVMAHALTASVRSIAGVLGTRKALKVLGHVRYLLTPHPQVIMGGQEFRLAVLDRQGAYWALDGISSEPETRRWVESFAADQVFYDIGANIGLYSLFASLKTGCRCVSIEPNPFSYDGLIRNVLLNKVQDKVIALCMAVGDDEGLLRLGMVTDESGAVGSTLAQSEDGRTQVAAVVTRLDSLVKLKNIPFPNHVKIDVDGIEDQILAGAQATLADSRVKSVLIEVCDRQPEQVTALRSSLEACGLALSQKDSSETNWIFRRA